ncbi:MAG: DUF3782 domain-containing protein [Leptolyngbyaceae cyanobacterium SM2_3_12]|nr:DUF3782 domain-containing protein [Leptolyngbyaceae cyanobacterium SM2_3_12]
MATTADDVWRLLGELTEAQKETERVIKEQSQASDRRFQESDRRFQETERLLREQTQETERLLREQSQETDRQIQATISENQRVNQQLSQQLSKQLGELGGAWGRFVENLVAPACETIFLARGIPVHQVNQRVRKRQNGDTLEIDVLVLNQEHVLVVEVKSTLGVEDIKAFVANLERFYDFFPEYSQRHLYGAVAGISIEDGADRYAYRQGLFVLAQSGETVVILNDAEFQPRDW